MTRKDYIALAAAVAAHTAARRVANDYVTEIAESAYADGARSVARCIADALAADNPRFDRSRFLAACGVAPAPATTGAEG